MAAKEHVNSSDLFTETFHAYNEKIVKLRQTDFRRLHGEVYLDHAGAPLYPESLLSSYHGDLCKNVYGNPHSSNNSSQLSSDVISQVRSQILRHFHTTAKDYKVIFTSGATQALKTVIETFDFHRNCDSPVDVPYSGGCFCYLDDNHTSVLGMREIAFNRKVQVSCLKAGNSPFDHLSTMETIRLNNCASNQGNGLFVYPAQSNFNGTRYPLSWIRDVQSGQLSALDSCRQSCVLLDAAGFVGTSDLALSTNKPDFVVISFYKMFGFPTGLGALLVCTGSEHFLRKQYFGGGTVHAAIATEDYHVKSTGLSDRFEDGTLPFLDIVALKHGFEALSSITGSMRNITDHTSQLSRYLYQEMSACHHSNGRPVFRLYSDTDHTDPTNQGPVVTFNVYDHVGDVVGYDEVEKLATAHNIHIRVGCFCNLGACHRHLGIDSTTAKQHLKAGHVCGDGNSVISGRPTGAVRVSLGFSSTLSDVDRLLGALRAAFCMESSDGSQTAATTDAQVRLDAIYIYPVKSCAALEVTSWPLSSRGALYDRHWAVVTETGHCVTQKREPLMCLIEPSVDLESGTLTLKYPDTPALVVHEASDDDTTSTRFCKTRVCTDRVTSRDCGDDAANWLQRVLNRPGLRLVRQTDEECRRSKDGDQQLSLANEAQYLLINRTSVSALREEMATRWTDLEFDDATLVSRFRANLIVSTVTPYEEESWSFLSSKDNHFKVEAQCIRCTMIGIDQTSGQRSPEVVTTLLSSHSSKMKFGILLSHAGSSSGSISKGQLFTVTHQKQ